MKLILSFAAALAAAGGGYAWYSSASCDAAAPKSCCDAHVIEVVEAGLAADAMAPTACEKACEGKTDCDPADCAEKCDPANCTEGALVEAAHAGVVGNVDAAAMGGSGSACSGAMADAKPECSAAAKPECTKAKTCDKAMDLD